MNATGPTVAQHFVGKAPEVRAIYDRLCKTVSTFGPWEEDPKKTSIHLNRKTAFAGVATRKGALVLTVKATRKLSGPRVFKAEQASARRWHIEVKLAKPSDLDAEVIAWLRESYEMSA